MRGGLGLVIVFVTWLAACSRGFECGTPLASDNDVITRCGAAHQVCVCETNSCAARVPAADCPSGLRYVGEPFARSDGCVPVASASWIVKGDATDLRCPSEPPPDASPGGDG
ncbi:MAG TPA: hypothetical protein VKE22_10600 [Haliangiales bacterium]|nr:hypothetical protein [Haliangiales bacterium]